MNLRELKKDYYELSGKVSDVTRQLGFAGIGIIWTIRTGGTESLAATPPLMLALFLFAACLLGDFLQYAAATLLWGAYRGWWEKRELDEDKDLGRAPRQLNWPGLFCFWSKQVFCLLGYGALFSYLWDKL